MYQTDTGKRKHSLQREVTVVMLGVKLTLENTNILEQVLDVCGQSLERTRQLDRPSQSRQLCERECSMCNVSGSSSQNTQSMHLLSMTLLCCLNIAV